MTEAQEVLAPTMQDIHYEKGRRHFSNFAKLSWEVVEPDTPLIWGPHLDAMGEYLEAVARRQIVNLIINIQARMTKSTLVSVLFHPWVWIDNPGHKFLSTSYADDLAIRDNAQARRLIESDWYRKGYGDRYKLANDENQKKRYRNDKGGVRYCAGVGGAITGEGGDTLLVDDPHNIKRIHSKLDRKNVLDWYDKVFSTRVNDRARSARIVVMQRGHDKDLCGHLEEKAQEGGVSYEVLKLPGVTKERTVIQMPVSGSEYVRDKGDILGAPRFNAKAHAEMKVELGTADYNAQVGQDPAEEGGNIIKRAWWRYYDVLPTDGFTLFLDSWDTAFKKGQENDFSANTFWGQRSADIYLVGLFAEKVEYPELKKAVKGRLEEHNEWAIKHHNRKVEKLLVEDKASGQSINQELERDKLIKPVLEKVKPDIDKVARVHAISADVEAGTVYLPNPAKFPWVVAFLDQFDAFPLGEYDDIVDTATQAISFMSRAPSGPRIRRVA